MYGSNPDLLINLKLETGPLVTKRMDVLSLRFL